VSTRAANATVDNFVPETLDNLYARVDTNGMKNTTDIIESKVYGRISREQAIELLRQQIAADLAKHQTASFSNGTPKGGWTDADRVAK
jgi:hypothetical protein